MGILSPGAFIGLESLHRTDLFLNLNEFESIEANVLTGLKSLRNLYLNVISLSNINNGSFLGMNKLAYLDLYDDLISKIPNNSFIDLPSLNVLNLGRNLITEIELNAFKGLTNLININLELNALTLLPSYLFNHTSLLRKLSIADNLIKQIEPSALCGLEKSLIQLNLSINRMDFIKLYHFANLGNLVLLDLSKNSFSSIESGAFDYLENLQELLLNDNCLFQIHESQFTRLVRLRFLNLNQNLIKNFNLNSFKSQNMLTSLSLSSNLIERFIIGENLLPSLSFLDLSSNFLLKTFRIRIKYILINLNGNKMANFSLTRQTVELDLSFNNLTLHSSFFKFKNSNLRKLWLQNSILNSDLNFLNNFEKLLELDLSSASSINWKNSTLLFNQLTLLEVLKLGNLNLSYPFVESTIGLDRFKRLTYLDLSGNRLEYFYISNLATSLESVILARNRIKHVPNDVSNAKLLDLSFNIFNELNFFAPKETITIRNNNLTRIGLKFMEFGPRVTIDLSCNSISYLIMSNSL
jgi:hypothetical protein